MGRVYITGDCHADFHKFTMDNFPEQRELTRDDFVIVCGDFGGIWSDTQSERYWLNWLAHKKFTLLFVDGNHENFDRLYSDEFKIVDFHGGKAHQIRKNIFHLMRGYVFNLCGKTFFTFGGAKSHDIQDGILEPDHFKDHRRMINAYNYLTRVENKKVRINHISWWKEEVPTDEEMDFGLETLQNNKHRVDYIVTHCCPQSVASWFSIGEYKPEITTKYLDKVARQAKFKRWYFGHYHCDKVIDDKYVMLYHKIERVI